MRFKFLFLLGIILSQLPENKLFAQDPINMNDTVQASVFRHTDLDTTYRYFKNTDIKILPPKHFVEFRSGETSGFVNTGTAASIVAAEYKDTPYVGYYDALAEEAFSQVKNAVYTGERSTETYSGRPAKFYFYEFTSKGVKAKRIIFFTGDESQMVFLQANYPAAFDALIKDVIIESFLTVEYE
jgi:hypothetical protein